MPARLFSVASWNVEHFGSTSATQKARVERVADFIKGANGGPPRVPEVFALYEVEGKDVYFQFMKAFPEHRFHLTEGKQTQEIFVGVHRSLQSFTTQRLEFKTQRDYQRPGLLLSVCIADVHYPLLFLHVRSGASPEDFGLRDAAIDHAFNLKKALDDLDDDPSNYMFLGDLNTMGIDDTVPYSKVLDFPATSEITRLSDWAKRRDMTLVSKDTTPVEGEDIEVTWWNGSDDYDPSNLDHLVASDHLDIRNAAEQPGVSVLGWPKLPPDEWTAWFEEYSDHGLLYFEVWGE